jgi:hypothetical protein
MALQAIYRFYAELADFRPKIWRRFEVAQNVTMSRLAYVLMTLYEMEARHLFQFRVPEKTNYEHWYIEKITACTEEERAREQLWINETFSDNRIVLQLIDEDSEALLGRELLDASMLRLRDVIAHPGDRLYFDYDFGDGWEVDLLLEDIRQDTELSGRELPRVLQGEGYGIVEDCGGPEGLEELATAFKKKKGKHYQDMREWLGVDSLDLSTLDLDDMNFRLKKVPRIYADLYEYELEPTRRSMDILTRKYKTK